MTAVLGPFLLQHDFSLKLALFLGGLVVLLVVLAAVVRWWGRLYREREGDESSPFRRVLKNSRARPPANRRRGRLSYCGGKSWQRRT